MMYFEIINTIAGLSIHCYITAGLLFLIPWPARMLFNGLRGKFDLR